MVFFFFCVSAFVCVSVIKKLICQPKKGGKKKKQRNRWICQTAALSPPHTTPHHPTCPCPSILGFEEARGVITTHTHNKKEKEKKEEKKKNQSKQTRMWGVWLSERKEREREKKKK